MKSFLFLSFLLVITTQSMAYTSAAAEDAFFWHYWKKVVLQPSPTPPGEKPEFDNDFGLFFGNTSQWESFFALGGVGNWLWGADWFTDKQMDPHFAPFSEDHEKVTAARWILGYVSKNTFGLPWRVQLGSYLRLISSPTFSGTDMLENPNLIPYTYENALRLSMGFFVQSKIDTRKFVSQLHWVPGIGGFAQPTYGLIDIGYRTYKTLIGPEAIWRTADSAAAFQLGLQIQREDFGFSYTIKAQNSYRQYFRKLDYSAWSEALSNASQWNGIVEISTPALLGAEDEMHQKIKLGAWYGSKDGGGWMIGISHYFTSTLHMDISLAKNDWNQDPVVGRTDSYKFLLSYYN